MKKLYSDISSSIVTLLLLLIVWMFLVLGCSKLLSRQTGNSTPINIAQTNSTSTNNVAKTTPTIQKPSTKSMAWMLGSNLSLAALMNERGNKQLTDEMLTKANTLSNELLGEDVPALPTITGGGRGQSAADTMGYLLKTALPTVEGKIKNKYGSDQANLFELAMKSNSLLLIYAPNDNLGKSVSDFIEKSAPQANLPERVWKPVTDKIKAAGTYDEIKALVFKMHADVRDYLASSTS